MALIRINPFNVFFGQILYRNPHTHYLSNGAAFDKSPVLIGRSIQSGRNDIIVNDGDVSRHHVEVGVDSDGLYVEDQGSENGTYPISIPDARSLKHKLVLSRVYEENFSPYRSKRYIDSGSQIAIGEVGLEIFLVD